MYSVLFQVDVIIAVSIYDNYHMFIFINKNGTSDSDCCVNLNITHPSEHPHFYHV